MDALAVSLSGMNAAALGVAVAANNVANANTPGFRARSLTQEEAPAGGVELAALEASPATAEPGGSNVDLASEFVSLDTQSLAYEANLKAFKTQDELLGTALDLKA